MRSLSLRFSQFLIRKLRSSQRLVIGTLSGLAVFAGCAMVRPTESGFLADYSALALTTDRFNWGGGRHRVKVQLPETGSLDKFDSFYIEPIVWLAPERDWLGQNETRRLRVSSELDHALRDQLAQIKPIVLKPGPGTARVRAAVTDVASAMPMVNAVMTGVIWGPVSNGGASVEAEVIGPDGRVIAAISGGSAGGSLDILGYYSRSGHPKLASRRLAGELAEALESPVKVR